jgi:hypothetical protein
MKNILSLFLATTIVFMTISCGQNNSSQKEAKNDSLVKTPVAIATTIDTASKEKPITELIITPQKKEGTLGQVTFSQNGKTLFYFVNKSKKGKIVINGTEYILKKLSFNNGTYKISGDQVTISSSKCKYNTSEGGDCAYGIFSTISLTLNGISTTINNVELQDCPDIENMGD